MIKDIDRKIEDSLSVLNDKDLDNSSFVNIDYLEYAIDKKFYGIIDAIFYLVKVEYMFEVNKNYELLQPLMKKYYQDNNIDLNLNTAKIYNTLEEYLSIDELNVFVKNSSIEQTLNNRISLISNSETDLLYKKQYTETLSDYVKKINPFETNKIIKNNKKSLFKKNLTLNLSFIIAFFSFGIMHLALSEPSRLLDVLNIPNKNLEFMYQGFVYNFANLGLLLSSIFVFVYTFRSNLMRNIVICFLLFCGFNIVDDLYYQSSTLFSTPKKEVLVFDKVSVVEDYKSTTVIKKGQINNEEGIPVKEFIWPENLKIKKGIKYEVKRYENLIVDIKEVK